MKNYSNPYQAPALDMISTIVDESGVSKETITDFYDQRVESGFRALFAGTDGWYDIYRDSKGNYIKQKVGSNSGSGSADLTNYYNKQQTEELVDNKINEAVIVKQGNSETTLDVSVKRYYFLATSIFGNHFFLSAPENNSTWEFVIIGEYYDDSSQDLSFQVKINNVYTYEGSVNNKSSKIILCTSRGGLIDFIDITPATREELSQIPKFNVSVVEQLPTENISNTTVYLISNTATEGNLYTEYIHVNGNWEILGTQSSNVNLDNYYTKEEIDGKGFLTINDKDSIVQSVIEALPRGEGLKY